MGNWLKRVKVDEDGSLVDAGFVILQTPVVIEFAESVSDRFDEMPEGSTLDWIEPADYDDELGADDCFASSAVLESLRWIRRVAAEDTKENRRFFEDREQNTSRAEGPLSYSPDRLVDSLSPDLSAMVRLCEEAGQQKQGIIHVYVP
jgi:hypothetical protein